MNGASRKPKHARPPAAAGEAVAAATTQAIMVLGMHRSGTSAITRVLNLMGCALPADLIGPGDGNDQGHWEAASAVQLNDEILASAGSNWQDWGPINADWRQSGVRAGMQARVCGVLRDHMALGPLFALKDPRMCRLADLWLDSMDALGVEPRVLLMLRHPSEVIASLEHRDLMPAGYAQLLWLRHVLDAEYFSRGRRRTIGRYDQLLAHWPTLVERVRTDLGVALPRNSPAIHADIAQFLNAQHRHHAEAGDAQFGDPTWSDWLRRSHAILHRWSDSGEDAADHAALDAIRHAFDQAYAAFAPLLLPAAASVDVGSGSRLKRELHAQLAAAHAAGAAAEASIAAAQARLAALDDERAGLATQADQLGEALAAAQGEAQALRTREAELASRFDADAAQLAQLHAERATLAAQADQLGEALAAARGEAEALRARETELINAMAVLEATLQTAMADAQQQHTAREAAESRLAESLALVQAEGLRNAELAGRSAAAESALVQRQEELAQLWAQLLVAEKASSAAEMRAELEQARRSAGEQQLVAAEARIAELTGQLATALAAPPPDHLFDELAELTRLLQAQEAATQAAEAAADASRHALDAQKAEAGQLASRLQHSEAARTATEQKLSARFDEIARMTALLADEGGRASTADANAQWLARMAQQIERFPAWWALMPARWRRQCQHARYARAGLFDAARYLELYPDVASAGIDPVRHYILHGMSEGRRRPQ